MTYIDEVSRVFFFYRGAQTKICQKGYFPLVVKDIPDEQCPQTNECCWCSFGNATSFKAWCCVTIACNATDITLFEDFAISACSANVGINNPGRIGQCPPLENKLKSINLITSITAATATDAAIVPPPTVLSSILPAIPTTSASSIHNGTQVSSTSEPKLGGQKILAIAISVTIVGLAISQIGIFLFWRKRRARKRRRKKEDMLSTMSELPTESNIHELGGQPMTETLLPMPSRKVMDYKPIPKYHSRSNPITPCRRETESVVSPLSASSMIPPSWSPITPPPQRGRTSKAFMDKALPDPPPPKWMLPIIVQKNTSPEGRL